MSVNVDEVRALAHAFARHLEYLREFRGVRYVGGAPMAVDDGEDVGAHPAAPTEAAPTADAPAAPVTPTVPVAAEPVPPAQPQPAVRSADPIEREPAAPIAAPAQPPVAARARPIVDNRPSGQSPHSNHNPQSPRPGNRGASAAGEAVANPARSAPTRAKTWPAAKKLGYLRERSLGDCQRCPLAKTRYNIVFGVGDPEADVMFIGEGPGAREDERGEPFIGAAGQRLDQWIERLGMHRADVYIANVIKCRPPNNRNPQPEEIERCSPFLHAQIRAIEPKVLVALGRFAGNLLLGADLKLAEMRGKVHRYREPKSGADMHLVVTYHPAYVLRREQETRGPRSGSDQPDRGGAIKSEEEKVFADLHRAVSLVRPRT